MDTCPIRLVDDETVLRLVDLETVALPFEVMAGRHLLIADSPGDFAACCGRLMRDPALGRKLASQGTTFARLRVPERLRECLAV